MSLATALLLIAQSVAPSAADAPVATMASVRASATVLRPAVITFITNNVPENTLSHGAEGIQRHSDAQGTVWIEFS
ncbi:hypothetical protein [Qipengyuania sp. ASV99]|uniref:hypothetical protein n=1 Tax=Qipengyuania sp. ASV99 TaxID=3399681 RepID=UPI003A4C65A9